MPPTPVRIRKHEAVPLTGSYEVNSPMVGRAFTSIGTISRDGGLHRTY